MSEGNWSVNHRGPSAKPHPPLFAYESSDGGRYQFHHDGYGEHLADNEVVGQIEVCPCWVFGELFSTYMEIFKSEFSMPRSKIALSSIV